MEVIRNRAQELEASELIEIRKTDITKMKQLKLGIAGKYQCINAALAKELCRKWEESCAKLGGWNTEKVKEGLETASWPGRSQTFKQGDTTWFFDGAHTAESIDCCVDWFKSSAQSYKNRYFLSLIN